MWGRVVEIMTGVWLAACPFIFGVQDNLTLLWIDLAIATIIWILSGLSYWKPTRHSHLLILVVAIGLIAWGRFAVMPPTPIHQNHIAIGIFLLMIAIIPNDASRPPSSWRIPIDRVTPENPPN